MFNIILFMFFMIMNILFMMSNTPLTINLIILILMINNCMLMNFMMNSPWYSYITFIMFVSGLMILFMYMCSITSSMKFTIKNIIITLFMMTISISIILFMMNNMLTFMKFNYNNFNNMILENSSMMLMKLFNNKSLYITIMIIITLFMMLIFSSHLIFNMNEPMRKKY
uniref:NADH dehydrogenase subunit 6 n=1 Tax=Paduniella communis TaxID=2904892 RepID=A0A9E8LP56_9NEOP|nr:NADH dehydrogenase subunit 6 [Paduniella communis]UZZ44257.1 NADH dehydrogenase subunit 6 [Paduniella communis]